MRVHRSAWHDLDPQVLHDIVRLRVDVFVVEQACAYPELDGRDVEPATTHVWSADDHGVAAYLRVLDEPTGGRRIGRVVTRPDARGRGLSARLVESVVRDEGGATLVLDAQSHLTGFYERFGFTPCGEEFVEDGIPHVPMRRGADVPPRRQGGDMTDQLPEPADPQQDPATDDRDVAAAAEALAGPDDPEALATDALLPGDGDDPWDPPQAPSVAGADGYTPSEEAGRESIDDRLAQEEPEPDPTAAGRLDAEHDLRET